MPWNQPTLLAIATLSALISSTLAVRCLDCVGQDCMGTFCEGEYCVLSQYTPRWGSAGGDTSVVKGCLNGTMVSDNLRDHCEIADGETEPFTCFCKTKNCNGAKVKKLEVERVDLLTCVCKGPHCKKDKTCLGELCTFVKNHKTKKVEQGCVNASVPLVERRTIGSCMIPPITGAMHHNVAKEPADLLATESCICGSDYCNSEKPEITVKENEKCRAYVDANIAGNWAKSKNTSCEGEYCFTAQIKSKIGFISNYNTYGCVSFTGEDKLPEELDPTGCAIFESENLSVKTCFSTKDKAAIARARANQQVPNRRPASRKGSKKQQKVEIDYEDDNEAQAEEEDEEEEKVVEKPRKGSTRGERVEKEEKKEKEENKEEKDEKGEKEKEEDDEEDEEENEESDSTTPKTFIFEKPTQPPIPDDSNTTMIAVFVLIILCILGSGIIWKFELHKKLHRSSYDTVAGG